MRSYHGKKAVRQNVMCPQKHCQGEHGWCGTVPMNGDSETVAWPTIDSGWGYCTDDCRGDYYCFNRHISTFPSGSKNEQQPADYES